MEDRLTPWTPSGVNRRFREKVASSATHVHPQTLPSTPGSAKYHSMRVYLQVQEWKGSADGLLPTEWELCGEGFVPLQTAQAPAPENLLRIIRCSCLTDCSTLRCTTRSTTLSVLRLVETVGDRAARTHYKFHVTMAETMMLRKYKSFDCSKMFLRFTIQFNSIVYFRHTFGP